MCIAWVWLGLAWFYAEADRAMEKASKPDASKEVLRKRTMATWIQMRKLHVFISLRSWWEIFEAHQISQDIRCQSSFDSPTHQISPDYWHHGIIHIIYHIYIIPDIYIYIIYHISYISYIYIYIYIYHQISLETRKILDGRPLCGTRGST